MASIAGSAVSFAKPVKAINMNSLSFSGARRGNAFLRLQPMPMRFAVCCSAKQDTLDKVCEIVKKQLAIPEGTEVCGSTKFSDLGADSLDTRIPQSSCHCAMATTAVRYGCSAALSFNRSPFACRSPLSRVYLASSNPMPWTPVPSLRVSYRRRRLYICACSGDIDPDASAASLEEARFDIKLPRRSLLVQFTCNKCDARTERLINRVAYERGTVFLQCAGCQVYHKFVDNLGLVVEYDFREENGLNTSTED